jgi:hypothetical protein
MKYLTTNLAMNLFSALFGKKVPATKHQNSQVNSTHTEDWDFYFSNVGDIIGSFYIDLGLAKLRPKAAGQILLDFCKDELPKKRRPIIK